MSEMIIVEYDGPVAIVRLNRPPANAIDLDLCRAFDAGFDEVLARAPGALVLTGTGSFFSAGLDLKVVPTYDPERQRELIRTINRFIAKLYGCPMPVVGAINGHAVAAGFILALATDYRIGPAAGAKFGLTEARVGIPFPAGPMIVLQAELAPSDARYVALVAKNFGADEALARGLFDELCPADVLEDRAVAIARDMATIPADAYRRVKGQLRRQAQAQLEELCAEDGDPMLDEWFGAAAATSAAAVLRGKAGT